MFHRNFGTAWGSGSVPCFCIVGDATINIVVGDQAPTDYFSAALVRGSDDSAVHLSTITDAEQFWHNLDVNCIPREVTSMTHEDYPDFLQKRRKLMALKIRDYYSL